MLKLNSIYKTFFATVFALILLQACTPSQYYLSPFHANSQPYRSVPMSSDSVRSATYASGTLNLGLANEDLSDRNFSFHGSIHRAHNFKWFNFYYGANLTGGNYLVSPAYNYEESRGLFGNGRRTTIKPIQPGNRFYGGGGLVAGASILIPFERSGSEWRVIGVESSYNAEFGDYMNFRRNVPDSLVRGNWKHRELPIVGFYTNPIRRRRKTGDLVGMKFGIYFSPERTATFRPTPDYYPSFVTPIFFSGQFHYTHDRTTGYAQLNIGNYAAGVQLGISHRISK
ncbi:MAG: hypothetical protein ABW174_13645 [Flavitalea sp.]